MEIGLKAKVKPEVDDRAVRQEAGRLRSSFEESLEDLEVAVELSDVIDRLDDAQDHVEEMSSETHRAATGVSEMKDAMESMDLSALEKMQEGDFGMDVLFGDGPAQMGGQDQAQPQQQDPGMVQQGLQSVIGRVGDRASGRTGQMAQGVNEKLDGMNSTLGRIGKGLLGGAAVIAIGGLALQYLSDTVDALASTSPLLETVVSMFGLAMSLFFRPFASMLGSLLLPIAASALKLAAEFNTVFGEEGIGDALAFLATEIVAGIINATLSVDIIGGLMGAGEMALLGGDEQFGIQDAFRIAIIGAIGKVAIGRILSRGILSMLPRITAARLINVFAFPKLGTFIANRLGSTLMKASITEILEAGFRQLLQRAFGPVVAQASFKTLWQAAFRTLTSKIPSLGIKAFLGRIFPSIGARGLISGILPKIGVRAILGRLLPSIGVRAILSKIGLMAVLRVLSGRLVYLIPVVGQIIGILDLLIFAITALIPGMEAFSPIMWTLTKLFEGLVWVLQRAWLTFEWLGGKIMEFGGWLMDSIGGIAEMLGGLSIGGIAGGASDMLGGILDVLGSIWTWFLSVMDPVMTLLQPVAVLLGLMAALAIQGWNMLMGFLSDPVGSLSGLFEGAMDLGSMAIDELITGTIELGEWMWDGAIGLGEWMWSGAIGLGSWMWSGAIALGEWIFSGTVALGQWLWSGTVALGQWLWSGTITLGQWIFSGTVALGEWIFSSTVGLGEWIFSGTVSLGQWIFSSTVKLGQWIFSGTVALGRWIFSGAIWLGQWLFSGAIWLGQWLFSGAIGLGQWLFSGAIELGQWLFEGAIDITEYVVGGTTDAAADATNAVNPAGEGNTLTDADLGDNPFWFGASGGIVTGATASIIGEGMENEAVLPLSRLESMINTPTMPSVPSSSGGGGGGSEQKVTVDISGAVDVSSDDRNDIATELQNALGAELDSISASVDELARKIQNSSLNGPIKITADGKVLAEVDAKGNDKYKRTRDVTK